MRARCDCAKRSYVVLARCATFLNVDNFDVYDRFHPFFQFPEAYSVQHAKMAVYRKVFYIRSASKITNLTKNQFKDRKIFIFLVGRC